MLFVIVIVFDNCDVVVVNGELFIIFVIVLFVNKVFFRFVLELKSLELLIIVVKFGRGFCLIVMLVGIFCIGLLTMEFGIGSGMLWRGDVGRLISGFWILIFRDLVKGFRGFFGFEK